MNVLLTFIDSRMSNLDYTLGIFSNVFSQVSSGFQTQSQLGQGNTQNAIPVYKALNQIWTVWSAAANYTVVDWELVALYFMVMFAGLMNFKAPAANTNVAS